MSKKLLLLFLSGLYIFASLADEPSGPWLNDKALNQYPLASEQDLPRGQEIPFRGKELAFDMSLPERYKACVSTYRPIYSAVFFGEIVVNEKPYINKMVKAINCKTPVTCHCRNNNYFKVKTKYSYVQHTTREYFYACVEPPSAQVESEADYRSVFAEDDSWLTWLWARGDLEEFVSQMEGIIKFALPASACPESTAAGSKTSNPS